MVASVEPKIISSQSFGESRRFQVDMFRSRFGDVSFFVMDAQQPDFDGVIRQNDKLEDAVKNLAQPSELESMQALFSKYLSN